MSSNYYFKVAESHGLASSHGCSPLLIVSRRELLFSRISSCVSLFCGLLTLLWSFDPFCGLLTLFVVLLQKVQTVVAFFANEHTFTSIQYTLLLFIATRDVGSIQKVEEAHAFRGILKSRIGAM